jgi:hypothetical protein
MGRWHMTIHDCQTVLISCLNLIFKHCWLVYSGFLMLNVLMRYFQHANKCIYSYQKMLLYNAVVL